MLRITRSITVSLNQKFLTTILYRPQMAPVTRKHTTPTTLNIVNKTISADPPSNKDVTPKKRWSFDKTKPKSGPKSENIGKDGLPIVAFSSQNELEKWIRTNHTLTTGLWVKIAKRSSRVPTVTYDELLDVVLCYGWIDGQRCGLDETWFLQRITPRRPRSNWSQINRERVKRLIRTGKMHSAGQRLIDEAKADGRWDSAYEPSSGCVIPDELTAAVEESSADTIETFRKLSKAEKLILIKRIERTESLEERNECIRSIVQILERGEVIMENV